MRVLIVEDDRRLAAALRRGLLREGFSVDLVEDGEEAIAAAAGTSFDVIVLDVMLPGEGDGFTVCTELRNRRIRTPCPVVSTSRSCKKTPLFPGGGRQTAPASRPTSSAPVNSKPENQTRSSPPSRDV